MSACIVCGYEFNGSVGDDTYCGWCEPEDEE